MIILTCIVIVAEAILCARATSASPLQVVTDSGVLYGFVDPSAPAVRQFLGVPFALPPTGTHRWLPPAALTASTLSINATSFSPSCPQIPLSVQTLADVFSPKGGNQTEFFAIENFSEDCLTLNVWAPARTHAEKFPVLVWFFGGGFQQGGTNSLYYNPTPWIQRTQAHIVVSVNFRSNIFGFPNAAGLPEQNLGLLDQRASLEWVRANIAAFGGDTAHIVAWGESAGAIAIDFLNFAFPDDPIVWGSIMESGTVLFPSQITMTNDTAQVNFAAVGGQLGCAVGAGQVDCLRNVAWQDIEALLASNASIPKFLLSLMTALSSLTTAHDTPLAHLRGFPLSTRSGTRRSCAQQLKRRNCARRTESRRSAIDTTGTLRISRLLVFSGAYHASELPLLFGTAGKFHGPSTSYENVGGLKRAGWSSFEAGKAVLLGDADVPMKVIELQELDGVCTS
ncbi:para-nitrobenzyl esterase [Mycena olivaceomarginata]|nr:para-nitrobenzyl esterase [Mycena olivaceomarginata]